MSFKTTSQKLIEDIEKGANLLVSGDVVGIPTETVYGLAARIDNESAVKKIFHVKERPFFDPLIVHVASIDQAKTLTSKWTKALDILTAKFWPGPLTLVIPKSNLVSDVITSGLENVAIRMPRHPVALELIHKVGTPLAAPSANKFGKTSPSDASHVYHEFGDSVFVVDGGPCAVGIESTVVKVVDNSADTLNTNHNKENIVNKVQLTLLRAGNILPKDLVHELEKNNFEVELLKPGRNIEAPGQVEHHYMPPIPLVFFKENETQVANKLKELNSNWNQLVELKLSDDPALAARELYSQLRTVSRDSNNEVIYFVRKPHHQGEAWEGIVDRIWRASAYKV